MVFVVMSKRRECAVQSKKKKGQFGKEMFDRPKSVRSKVRRRLPGRSCMCMATMPMLSERSRHSPAAAAVTVSVVEGKKPEGRMSPVVGWRVERRRREERRDWNAIVSFLEGSWKRFGTINSGK